MIHKRNGSRRLCRLCLTQSLEPRLLLSGVPLLFEPTPAAATSSGDFGAGAEIGVVHAAGQNPPEAEGEGEGEPLEARLTIFLDSQPVVIPENIGVDADGTRLSQVRTLDGNGTLRAEPLDEEPLAELTLGDFFDTWRTNAGQAGNNPDAILSPDKLLVGLADTTNTVQMFVNGRTSDAFDSYVIGDGDQIVLIYGPNPVVSLNTNFGPLVMELFQQRTPGTVENFLNYINDGDYIDSFFHRSAPDFVIQGGGFSTTSSTFTDTAQFSAVPTDAPILNEPGISNVRGTVGMAKLGGNPNSATSQFFVNLRDSNAFLDSRQSGSFTVFAQVLDMATVDQIAALPVNKDNAQPFGELPLSAEAQLPVVESIEGLGNLRGVKFRDDNANGMRDPGEPGISGISVYLDDNGNGLRDSDEVVVTTDDEGRFLFQLEPGTCTVRAEVSSGSVETSPTSPEGYTGAVEIGRTMDIGSFGESLRGDIDLDGGVNFSDFVILANNFNRTEAGRPDGDLDGDGAVQFSDFVILADHFGLQSRGQFDARLTIFFAGEQVEIPADIGVGADTTRLSQVRTMDGSGTLRIEPIANEPLQAITVGDFLETWRTNAGNAGNNPDAVLSQDQLLAGFTDATNTIQMFVNGIVSTELAGQVIRAGDEIVLVYGANPVVSLNTNLGPIVMELFAQRTPGTVDNFLNYINDGDYLDSFFHRTVRDFVIQGGGFKTTAPVFTSTAQFSGVPTDPPILNEPGISNVRGTVGMAKLGGDPNSATSQFFVNLNDDNAFLDLPQSGSFTVFAQVLDMTTVDEIEGLRIDVSNASPFGELPLNAERELAVVQSVTGQGRVVGTKFRDDNANGQRDDGEPGIPGVVVFLDSNDNGALDTGELSVTTDADGHYLLQIAPGTYPVRSEISPGHVATQPDPPDGDLVTVEIGRHVTRDFGEATTGQANLSSAVAVASFATGAENFGQIGFAPPEAQVERDDVVRHLNLTPSSARGFIERGPGLGRAEPELHVASTTERAFDEGIGDWWIDQDPARPDWGLG